MLSSGKNTKHFLFSHLFHFLQADGWRDKDVLSHSSLLKGSEDAYESAQPSVHQVMGLVAFTCHPPMTGLSLPDTQKWFQNLTDMNEGQE